MFSWTVVPAAGFDMEGLISTIVNGTRVEDDTIRNLRSWLFKCEMRVCLREMVSIAIDILENDRNHPRALSFIAEFVAGLKYAYDDKSVGRMRELKMQFNCCTTRHAIEFLRVFCVDAWKKELWKDKHMWFQLRVHCMDAYVLSHVLSAKAKKVFYYAGSSHTKNLEDFIVRKRIGRVLAPKREDQMWKTIRTLAATRLLSHIVTIRFKDKSELMMVGEEHNLTDTRFGTDIIEMMQSLCTGEKVLFLIEKHISNNKDTLQCELMCNQPSLALHKSRCSDFVLHEHSSCDAIEVVAVDNRHTDMGFLRVELMDLWNDNDAFRTSSEEFQQSSLLSMHNFCSTLLLCNKLRYSSVP